MAEENKLPQHKTSPTEAKTQQPCPDTSANSCSVDPGSQSALLGTDPRNDTGGHNQQHHRQPVQQDPHREEQNPARTENEYAQLHRWAYETSNSELTVAERLERQRWENDSKNAGDKSEERKRE